MDFLTITEIPSKVIEIIENTEEFCFLVTPYFDSWPILERTLKKAAQNNKKIIFIFRKDTKQEVKYLNENYGFDIVFIDRLHTKLYLNEKSALITSMNLYKNSKENNYELGVFFDNRSDVKKIFSKIIEDDLLGLEDHKILQGRYFREKLENEKVESEKLKEKERQKKAIALQQEEKRQQQIELQKNTPNSGFCIRCGNVIPLNTGYPMCMRCFSSWDQFKNPDYRENYCHICRQDTSSITMNKPLCDNCCK